MFFLSLDSQTCFKCKQGGHIAAQCPTTIQQSTIPANENSSAPSPPTEETSPHTEETPAPTEETNMQYMKQQNHLRSRKQKIQQQTNTRSDIDINTVVSTAKRGFSETLTPENESTSGDHDGVLVRTTGIGHPVAEQAQQLGEIDGARRLAQHLVQLLLVGQFANSVEGGAQISFGDDAVLVVVHKGETFLELGYLHRVVQVEMKERIAGG
nr:unnamed protein product [Callosobruchus analis]